MPRKRRPLNPARQQVRMQLEQRLRALRCHVQIYHQLFAALVGTGNMQVLHRMMEARAVAELLLTEMMPDFPELYDMGELEVKDITGEVRKHANFAIIHRGRVLKDGFATDAAARLYIHRQLIVPAQMLMKQAYEEDWPAMDQPSRSVH